MKKFLYQFTAVGLCVYALLGCGSMNRSEFEAPQLDIPSSWTQVVADRAEIDISPAWWKNFNDEQLNALIQRVLESNSDLALATLTLRKARLETGLSEEQKIPDVDLSQNSSAEKNLDSGNSEIDHNAKLSLSYELDLWGRLDAASNAKEWHAKASYEDRESTKQSLIVTTASLYWKLGYLHQRLALAKGNINGTQKIVDLTKKKLESGSATKLEVLESTQSLFEQLVNYRQIEQDLGETKNAISLLLNTPLQDIRLNIDKLSDEPLPTIAAGIPSDLILRRPDVKASLYALRSALSNQDSVDANYLPRFTLTSSLSSSSTKLLEILQNPIAALGSGLTLPFMQWNEMQINKGISKLDYEMAIIDYRKTLYTAFEEVDNLLSHTQLYRYQSETLYQQLDNAQQIEAIYASKYRYGESSMIDWINAIESKRNKEVTVIENRYNQLITQAKLYQSLGGGDH